MVGIDGARGGCFGERGRLEGEGRDDFEGGKMISMDDRIGDAKLIGDANLFRW